MTARLVLIGEVAKVKRISSESLGKLKIPVPPQEEQERIVAIPDRFDALVYGPSIGLPAEIARPLPAVRVPGNSPHL